MHKIQKKSSKEVRNRRHVVTAGCAAEHCSESLTTSGQTVTTNILDSMDVVLVSILLSCHYANAALYEQRRRFVERQEDSLSLQSSSSSNPTQTSPSPTNLPTPASIRTQIPVHSSASPSGEVQTAIPVHPHPGLDKGPIIGFSIAIVVFVALFVATGWVLFTRYKKRKQRRVASKDVVQLQSTNHSTSNPNKKSIDDTQSAASQL